MDALTTFSDAREFARAVTLSARLGVDHQVVSPSPAYAVVGCPASGFQRRQGRLPRRRRRGHRQRRLGRLPGAIGSRARTRRRASSPRTSSGRVAIVVLATCIADAVPSAPHRPLLRRRRRGSALPQRGDDPRALTSPTMPVLTYMDGHRMVSLFRDRIGIAKANDIVDAWATLERVRCLANDVWSRRAEIDPLVRDCAAGRRRSRSTSACRARTAASAASRPARRSPGPCGAETPSRIAVARVRRRPRRAQ